ncbi:MAG TPA: alkaline phosphatase family protein [Actinomycetota bacterium]|nr:alkaline phosphatase family protein [Actinomycetota bacterium]
MLTLLTIVACDTTPPAPLEGSPPLRRTRCDELPELARRVKRGYVPGTSPDVNLIPREPNYVGTAASPVHSGPWDYLARVPLVVYGAGHVKADSYLARADMADLAPTAAELIGANFDGRSGRPLTEALLPDVSAPRLVVTMVWDGGGNNVLAEHPDSYPFLRSLQQRSARWPRMTIGSSPSVTPPIHATLSTGVYPNRHKIPGLRIRNSAGEYLDPFLGLDPSNMRSETLADVYDREFDNKPVVGMLAAVNWHLSMIGHGSALPRADKDPAVLFDEEGVTFTNTEIFSLPAIEDVAFLERSTTRLDAADGFRDGEWRGHSLDDPEIRYSSPAHVAYQQHLLERLVETERFGADSTPDLLYVNFKPSDDAGHTWGMTSPEVGEVVEAQDTALKRFVGFLDERVGEGRWVLMLTADHGQTPYPRESGAWAIGGGELARDANAALDETDDGVDLIDRVSSPGAYVNHEQLGSNDLSLEEVGRWIAAYTAEQNVKEDAVLPDGFADHSDELLFDGVVVNDKLVSEACL